VPFLPRNLNAATGSIAPIVSHLTESQRQSKLILPVKQGVTIGPRMNQLVLSNETMRIRLPKTIAMVLLCTLALPGNAKPGDQPTKRMNAARRIVTALAPHARISVVRIQAPEEYGEFLSSNRDGFTFFDVDRKIDVTLTYEEVRKVKRGYGGYNWLSHTHTDRTKGFIAMGVVAGLLIGLIAVVAASPN